MTSLSDLARSLAERPRPVTLYGAPEGYDAAAIGDVVAEGHVLPWLHVCRDDGRMARFAAALAFFHPELDALTFPAWDCLPYDRVSPNSEIVSRRIDTLTRLATGRRRHAAGRADHGQRAGPARAAAPTLRRPRPDPAARRANRARPAAELLSQQRLHPHRHGARARRIRDPRRHRRPLPGGGGRAAAPRLLRRHAREHPQLRPADPALDRQARSRRRCVRSARCCSTMPRSGASARATASSSAPPAPTTRSTNRSAPAGAMSAWSIGCRSITSGWRPCSTTCPAPGSRSTTRRTRCATIGSRRSPISTPRATTSPAAARAGAPIYRPVRPDAALPRQPRMASGVARAAGRPAVALRRAGRATATSSTPAPARRAISPPSAPTRISCCSRRCAITSKPSAKPAARRRLPPSARARPSGS